MRIVLVVITAATLAGCVTNEFLHHGQRRGHAGRGGAHADRGGAHADRGGAQADRGSRRGRFFLSQSAKTI